MEARNKHIVIIDDEPDIVAYLSVVVESCGYVPHAADNADAGLRLAEKVRPTLICLDIMMPEESGISLYVKIRGHRDLGATPVIIISGVEQQQEFDIRAFVSNRQVPPPDHYIEKPINVKRFARLLKQICDKSRAETAQDTPL